MLAGVPAPPGGRVYRARGRLRSLSGRISLRTKLVAALLALLIFALAAIGVVSISLLRPALLNPTDIALKNSNNQQVALAAIAGNPRDQFALAQNGYVVWWIPAGGTPQVIGQSTQPGLAGQTLTSNASWLAANTRVPTTVPGQQAGDRWRILGFPATFNGTNGTVVIGTDVSSVYSRLQRFMGIDLAFSAMIVVVLAIIGFAVVQANLRPLVEIEETAGEIAEGHLNRRVPERGARTEVGSLGRSLNIMLSQIESAFRDREESEAAAHHSEERMRRFIADASHELRTPLTAIRGFAEYYRQRGGLGSSDASRLTPADLDRMMHRVEAEAARMGLLVEDLLMLARMDQQRPLARNPVDLLSLAADAVHDTRMLAPDRTISLSVQPGAAFLVIGDEPRLRQVIGNLMSNALTHTPDGTAVEVSIGSGAVPDNAEQAVTVAVKDHGPGMTPEQASRVFERFYRADQARTRATGGSGLGLSIVAALVAAHGGVTSVDTAPGAGATFQVMLPLAPEAQGWEDDDPGEEPDVADAADGVDAAFGTSRPA
jgi:two-component system, OmpR family, sensor kinase